MEKNKGSASDEVSKTIKAFGVIAAVILVGIIAVFWAYVENFGLSLSPKQEDWGAFGDYFAGLLNPIISFFAFLALLYTIRIQSEELRKSTEQLTASAKALDIQNKHWEKQTFENTFFQLVGYYQDIIKSMSISVKASIDGTESARETVEYKGKSAAGVVFSSILGSVDAATKRMPWADGSGIDEQRHNHRILVLKEAVLGYYSEHRLRFFASDILAAAYNVIHFVDSSTIDDLQKKYYSKLFFSYLSMDERGIVFYSSFDRGMFCGDFYVLAAKYNLFENLELRQNNANADDLFFLFQYNKGISPFRD